MAVPDRGPEQAQTQAAHTRKHWQAQQTEQNEELNCCTLHLLENVQC